MNRETTTERLELLREQLHEIADIMNKMALQVDILWEERRLRRTQGPREEDRQ